MSFNHPNQIPNPENYETKKNETQSLTMQIVSTSPLGEVSRKFENDFFSKLKIEDKDKHEVEEEDEDDDEFTFVLADPNGSLISADDVFDNDQIRPILSFTVRIFILPTITIKNL